MNTKQVVMSGMSFWTKNRRRIAGLAALSLLAIGTKYDALVQTGAFNHQGFWLAIYTLVGVLVAFLFTQEKYVGAVFAGVSLIQCMLLRTYMKDQELADFFGSLSGGREVLGLAIITLLQGLTYTVLFTILIDSGTAWGERQEAKRIKATV